MKVVGEGLSYDDVLLVPGKSSIKSRKDVVLKTRITKNLFMNIPIMSANMETVTQVEMAQALANLGGIGILHRYCSIDEQAKMVRKVKRLHSYIIEEPAITSPDATLGEAKANYDEHFGSFLVVDNDELIGILTERDIIFEPDSRLVKDLMTKEVIIAKPNISLQEAKNLLHKHRIEKLPLVDENNKIKGLITLRDILKRESHPHSTRDEKGRLRVGAAIGVVGDFMERAEALLKEDCDVLVLDVAHGHNELAINALKQLKNQFPKAQIIAGNVATADATKDLIDAGADAIKVGVGPGSICTTRLVAGAGVPQLTAIMEAVKIAKEYDIPVIADGGIKVPGDVTKAIGAGADSVMLGGMLAGTTQSPGKIILKSGKRYKVYRGATSFSSHMERKKRIEGSQGDENIEEYVPEGVEGMVPYKGDVEEVIQHLIGGLRSGMSYAGARTINEMQDKAQFIKITSAGLKESKSHDVQVS